MVLVRPFGRLTLLDEELSAGLRLMTEADEEEGAGAGAGAGTGEPKASEAEQSSASHHPPLLAMVLCNGASYPPVFSDDTVCACTCPCGPGEKGRRGCSCSQQVQNLHLQADT